MNNKIYAVADQPDSHGDYCAVGTFTMTDEKIKISHTETIKPSINIANHSVTMQDMFDRPEEVKELKTMQDIIDTIYQQIIDLKRQRIEPSAILMTYTTRNLIRRLGYKTHMYVDRQEIKNGMSDKFMGLNIALLTTPKEEHYIKVV